MKISTTPSKILSLPLSLITHLVALTLIVLILGFSVYLKISTIQFIVVNHWNNTYIEEDIAAIMNDNWGLVFLFMAPGFFTFLIIFLINQLASIAISIITQDWLILGFYILTIPLLFSEEMITLSSYVNKYLFRFTTEVIILLLATTTLTLGIRRFKDEYRGLLQIYGDGKS
jgi:hypothetical protein